MSSNKRKPIEYGKPYTLKELRTAGIALTILGAIFILFCYIGYRHGTQEQVAYTKVGNAVIPEKPPGSALHLPIGILGTTISLVGIVIFIKGVKWN